ncbi:MAG: hypothetical protein KF884_06530 [Fimbriimonadaceae bacterium]|nr:hypothetical protein [Fimbriimonadaceae bacterium]QYK57206.1 MAG: hypothetical protein KF884_06530 [Fimbriimonadaceae bacterium]
MAASLTSQGLADSLVAFQNQCLAEAGGDPSPTKPSHRVPFHWPPHPVSSDFHVLGSDWTGSARLIAYGEEFEVQTARTPAGVFARLVGVWNESRGTTEEEAVQGLLEGAEPYFRRQFEIAKTLGIPGRYRESVRSLDALGLLKLLYCSDRDVAHEASVEIEKQASTGLFGPALVTILRDQYHPNRRSAQWCVLDLFEDLPSLISSEEGRAEAVRAVRDLMANATDDYARTVYKAGVVLGGHVCTPEAADALIDCVSSPSRYGRRAAIHAVFHLVEWMPETRERVLAALELAATEDDEPLLRSFAASQHADIESGAHDHMTEPVFPDEP